MRGSTRFVASNARTSEGAGVAREGRPWVSSRHRQTLRMVHRVWSTLTGRLPNQSPRLASFARTSGPKGAGVGLVGDGTASASPADVPCHWPAGAAWASAGSTGSVVAATTAMAPARRAIVRRLDTFSHGSNRACCAQCRFSPTACNDALVGYSTGRV